MSAFLQSGRSEAPKTAESKVRFRPEAVIRVTVNLRRKRNPPCLTLFRQTSVGTVQQLNWIALYCIPFGSGLSGDYLV